MHREAHTPALAVPGQDAKIFKDLESRTFGSLVETQRIPLCASCHFDFAQCKPLW
jgi:hypothetical protein